MANSGAVSLCASLLSLCSTANCAAPPSGHERQPVFHHHREDQLAGWVRQLLQAPGGAAPCPAC